MQWQHCIYDTRAAAVMHLLTQDIMHGMQTLTSARDIKHADTRAAYRSQHQHADGWLENKHP